jgi:hypothetical protein
MMRLIDEARHNPETGFSDIREIDKFYEGVTVDPPCLRFVFVPIYTLSGRNSIEGAVFPKFVPLPDTPQGGGRQSEGITTGRKRKYPKPDSFLKMAYKVEHDCP